jgi:hypothetical protein
MVVLSIYSGIFVYVNNTNFFFHWHLFFLFHSYWFILRFCEHFTCLSSKIQNAIKLENISNLITSPSSYQCIRRKTLRLVHFPVIHGRHISARNDERMNSDFFFNIFTQELFNRIYVGKYTINMFFMLTSISLF